MLKEENIRLLFGLKLKQLRLERKKSLTDIAEESGISISYLNEIEKGKKYPKANKIAVLAKVLDVNYDWLVSLQLDKSLLPLAELFKSDLLTSLPLEIFGIEPADLLDTLASTPSKISAFISTLVEMARNYNMSVEHFYYAVLRSYQEMHENYFEDLEDEAKKCFENYKELQPFVSFEGLKKLLITQFNYNIEETDFKDLEDLQSFRTVFIPNKNKLLINTKLDENQKAFALCREFGFAIMGIKDRPITSSMVHLTSFEQLLNNFKASYFASALIISQDLLLADMQKFFKHKAFRADELTMLIHKYNASPEMFFHRLTNILPKHFDLQQLFFLRFFHTQSEGEVYDLNKELHLAGLYNPHGSKTQEHYCRRWISLNILKDLEKNTTKKIFCKAQRSKYIDSENEFFCISMAYQLSPNKTCSVTIGFLMTDSFKEKVNFWDDIQVPTKEVGVTCQRCSNILCIDRVAPATIYTENLRTEKIKKALANLIKKN
jgi:transcriptional regulator with XRE-family HTH domain/predicted transcriptional regulator